jgi:hypothetical protein
MDYDDGGEPLPTRTYNYVASKIADSEYEDYLLRVCRRLNGPWYNPSTRRVARLGCLGPGADIAVALLNAVEACC